MTVDDETKGAQADGGASSDGTQGGGLSSGAADKESEADLGALLAAHVGDTTSGPAQGSPGETPGESEPHSGGSLDNVLMSLGTGEKGQKEEAGAGTQKATAPMADGDAKAAPAEGSGIRSEDIDALFGNGDHDEVLAGHDEDALLVAGKSEGKDSVETESDASADQPEESPAPGGEPAVSQEMIDALVAAAGGESTTSEVGSENLAAAGSTPPADSVLLAENDLNEVIEQARRAGREPPAMEEPPRETPAAAEEAAHPEPGAKRVRTPRKKKAGRGRLAAALQRDFPRIAVCMGVATLAGLGVFTMLYLNQERAPDLTALAAGGTDALESAMEYAKALIASGDYAAAVSELEGPIREAAPGDRRTEAQFLLLEARYRGFVYEPGAPAYNELHEEIDKLVKEFPAHPRAPEALYWKARLHEVDELPYAAQDVYKQIIGNYPTASNLPRVLLDAATLDNTLRDPRSAAEYAQALIQRFPGSPLAGEARLVLGDAYLMAGMEDDARTLFVRTTQATPTSPLGAAAFLRLGRLAFDQGKYSLAIQQLETRLETATTIEGNDEVYLLLAQAYRQAGRLKEARDTLTDLTSFFPESAVTPAALVELSQVLDELGERKEALHIAQEAVARYPDNPAVLRNKGELLGLTGNAFAAAAALMAANEAGANDPSLVLTAARHYSSLGMDRQAIETYGILRDQYPFSDQVLSGGIEEAKLLYKTGEISQAVGRLEELTRATEGKPQRLPTLLALSEIYRDLGLDQRVKEVAELTATLTADPQVRAEAATALLDAGELVKAQDLVSGLDLARVTETVAYRLLTKLGNALLAVDPRRGLEKMEEAYLAYPQARNPQDEQRLLEIYLAAERPAAARRMVMELAARAREAPVHTAYLIDAAITWGDFCFAKGDFRTAADAYELALNASTQSAQPISGFKTDPRWAKYQRANALLELGNLQGSLALFTEIAASDAPWATEAGMKADYARLEERLGQGIGAPAGPES